MDNLLFNHIYKNFIDGYHRIAIVYSKYTKVFFQTFSLFLNSKKIEVKLYLYNNQISLKNMEPFDFIIIGTPLSLEDNKYIFNFFKVLEERNVRTIIFEWPIECYSQKYKVLLNAIFRNAIMIDYESLKERNEKIYSYIKDAKTINIISNTGTDITFQSNYNIILESCSFKEGSVFQVPGGEVFLVPKIGSVNGKISIEKELINVKNDYADFSLFDPRWSNIPICEFGIGTNVNIKYTKQLSITEKAFRTCHFGFGNNKNFGGEYERDFHFDLVLNDIKIFINDKEVSLWK